MRQVMITRRVREESGFVEKKEKAEVVVSGYKALMVRLKNGDVIKRKLKDVEEVSS